MAGVLWSSWPFPFVVPPCTQSAPCATATRCLDAPGWHDRLWSASRTVVAANPTLVISPPTALGGYRAWRCQVAEKGPPIGAKRGAQSTQTGPPTGSAALFSPSLFAGG